MSFLDLKISESAIQSTGVQSQPDTLTGSAADNKKVFDALPTLIIRQFNLLLEALGGTGAASEVPIEPIYGMTAKNVQQALAEISKNLADYIAKIKGTGGAAEVGVSAISGMSVSNTQQALAELKRLIDNLVIGALPPGSVTADMIADGAIVQLGALLAVAAAAAYDPEGSYAVGDYCTYQGLLYKCNTAIPSGEPWTAEHWTETTVAAELAEVSSSLSNKMISSFGELTANDLLNWGKMQTNGGSFFVNPNVTTTGLPDIPDKYFIGTLEIGQGVDRKITLTNNSLRTFINKSLIKSGETEPSWIGWLEIATATPPQEVPLPLASGVTELNVATAEKTQEGIVFVNAWVGFDSPVIANTETQVAIMPENMRPKKTIGGSAVVNSGDDENLGFARIRIDSGGVMRILSDVTFSFAVFSIAFPVGK